MLSVGNALWTFIDRDDHCVHANVRADCMNLLAEFSSGVAGARIRITVSMQHRHHVRPMSAQVHCADRRGGL